MYVCMYVYIYIYIHNIYTYVYKHANLYHLHYSLTFNLPFVHALPAVNIYDMPAALFPAGAPRARGALVPKWLRSGIIIKIIIILITHNNI